jgi:transcriptional regulator with XRE-family HTH domain
LGGGQDGRSTEAAGMAIRPVPSAKRLSWPLSGRCRVRVVVEFRFHGRIPTTFILGVGHKAMEMKVNTKLIKTLREERAWSQEHLATVAGLSARTVQRLEAEGNASLESRMAIATAFGVEPARLMCEREPATAPSDPVAVAQGLPPFDVARIILWTAILIVLMLMAGYGVGRDLAFRDNRRASALERSAPGVPFIAARQENRISAGS